MDIQRRTVLVIEDEHAITDPLSEALTCEGFHPRVARTIAQGLDIARTEGPDLVLLDLMLPDGSGFDALRKLRTASAAPVIMLTARDGEADRVAGLELGADDYVIKPFSARELLARIRAVLRRAGAAADPASGHAVRVGAVALDPSARTATLDGEPLELTRRHGSRGRVSLRRAGRGCRAMSLRVRMLAAFGYVLIFTLIALEIPPRRREESPAVTCRPAPSRPAHPSRSNWQTLQRHA